MRRHSSYMLPFWPILSYYRTRLKGTQLWADLINNDANHLLQTSPLQNRNAHITLVWPPSPALTGFQFWNSYTPSSSLRIQMIMLLFVCSTKWKLRAKVGFMRFRTLTCGDKSSYADHNAVSQISRSDMHVSHWIGETTTCASNRHPVPSEA
jgi:hypothetical protein